MASEKPEVPVVYRIKGKIIGKIFGETKTNHFICDIN
jgi:hypothetical protein